MVKAWFSHHCQYTPSKWLSRLCMTTIVSVIGFGFIAILYSWFEYDEYRFRREQEAADILTADYNAMISLEMGFDDSEDVELAEQPFRDFSQWSYGRLYRPVVDVFIPNAHLDERAWNQLKSFYYLKSLKLQDCSIAPAVDAEYSSFRHLQDLEVSGTLLSLHQVRTLAHLSQLEDLSLDDTGATDDWLVCIGQLRHLRMLTLNGNNISDDGISKLAALKELRGLGLSHTHITSKSAAVLSQFIHLQWLDLSETKFDDEGIIRLGLLADLELLSLHDTRITDKGVASLTHFKNLRELSLNNTNITDAGLKHLEGLSKLRQLDLQETLVTDGGARMLQKALPNCEIAVTVPGSEKGTGRKRGHH